jgi:hypothetical protein
MPQTYSYTEIYGTLCYATLLIQRARIEEPERVAYHIGRRHALYFEYVGEPNFDNVTKSGIKRTITKPKP